MARAGGSLVSDIGELSRNNLHLCASCLCWLLVRPTEERSSWQHQCQYSREEQGNSSTSQTRVQAAHALANETDRVRPGKPAKVRHGGDKGDARGSGEANQELARQSEENRQETVDSQADAGQKRNRKER